MRFGIVVLLLSSVPALAFASDHKKSKHASTSASTTTTTTTSSSTKPSKHEGTVTRHVEYMDGEQQPEPKHHGYSRAEIDALKQEQLNRAAGHPAIREGWKMPVDKEPSWDEREKHRAIRTAPTDDFDDPHGGSIQMKTDMNGNQMETHF
ncbi:MAG: hypothetical protein JST54_21505 [Deltaproteobacteria bacterium]|nr:hypothetical protein [Deltaproteobacteria bacterium]